ncbi:MAG TPA: hypothetical protein VNG73_00455 [Gemmatimonadaceae bacterium]|nr:hypothetical protein [Gemmatimonadaceae bacterium]
MSSTGYEVAQPRVDAERTTRELRSIVSRFLPGFELVEVAAIRQNRERDIRLARPMRPLSGRPRLNEVREREFPDQVSTYYVRTGADTYRVYVRPVDTDEPPKAMHLSTLKRCILSIQG